MVRTTVGVDYQSTRRRLYPVNAKKSPALMAGDIDKHPKMGYSIDAKGATSRQLPQIAKEK